MAQQNFVSDALTSWGLANPGGNDSPRVSLIPSKPLTHTFHMQTNYPRYSVLATSFTIMFWVTIPLPSSPSPSTGLLARASMLPDPLEWHTLANPRPTHPDLPILAHGNHSKGLCPYFPLLTPLPDWSWCFPVWTLVLWHDMSPCLRICEISWQSFLICWLCYTWIIIIIKYFKHLTFVIKEFRV